MGLPWMQSSLREKGGSEYGHGMGGGGGFKEQQLQGPRKWRAHANAATRACAAHTAPQPAREYGMLGMAHAKTGCAAARAAGAGHPRGTRLHTLTQHTRTPTHAPEQDDLKQRRAKVPDAAQDLVHGRRSGLGKNTQHTRSAHMRTGEGRFNVGEPGGCCRPPTSGSPHGLGRRRCSTPPRRSITHLLIHGTYADDDAVANGQELRNALPSRKHTRRGQACATAGRGSPARLA
jgi:hypothetical protein